MKISSGGIGTVSSAALAAAGSNIGGKRYIWAWDFSQISVAARANTFYANTGWHDGPAQNDPINLDFPADAGFGITYSQNYTHEVLQSHEEGLFIQTSYNWSSGRGDAEGPGLRVWPYNQFHRTDGQPHKMSGTLDDHEFSAGKYLHLVLKTQGASSPTYGEVAYRKTNRGTDSVDIGSSAVGTVYGLNADSANLTVAGATSDALGPGSGVGWVTGNPNGNPTNDGGGGGGGGPAAEVGVGQFDGITYKELLGSDDGDGAFQLAYTINRYGISGGGESTGYFNATRTYVSGDYRTIVWDLGDADGGIELVPRILNFKLFIDADTTTDNPYHYGSANVSFIVCGMVLSNEILTDIPLPIDIHRTLG